MPSNQKSSLKKHWSSEAIAYQIYPMSFKDSNGDGKGDLRGIIEKLDYLNGSQNSLGINTVWICPFYKSPMIDFGYDVMDFKDVDPIFGTIEDFEELVEGLHQRGIKIIIDFVGNHTSDKHPWFKESRSSKSNPKRDWYIWRDAGPDDGLPNNWISVFGGPAWQFDPITKQYYLHSFLSEQPDLNWHNPELRQEMMDVIDFWVKKGVDGFRVDAFLNFVEDKLFREDPINPFYQKDGENAYNSLMHKHSLGDLAENTPINQFLKEVLKKHEDVLIVCEAYIGPEDMHRLHKLYNSERFTVFNFNFINSKIEVGRYKEAIDKYLTKPPENFLPNFVIGNHDVDRVATRLSAPEAKILAFLQFTLPGMPFIYYGEELGMTNTSVPREALKDMIAQMFPGFHPGRDPERTPMQWDNSKYSGFSTNKPWLPINQNYKNINVVSENQEENSTLSLYKRMIAFRKGSEVLTRGEYFPRNSASPNVISFERVFDNKRLLVLANMGNEVEREILPIDKERIDIIFSTNYKSHHRKSLVSVELLPFEGCIIEVE